MKRIGLVMGTAIFLILAMVWSAGGNISPANAQDGVLEEGGKWASSAEAPAGTTVEQLSPADTPGEYKLQDDLLVPEGLVSWRVAGSALKPRVNDVSYTVSGGGGCTYVTSGDAFTVWNIPVDLQNGSVVDTLRMYYYDSSGSNTTAWFTVYDLYGGIVEEWNVSSNTNAGNSFNDSAQINHTIDYSVYSYLINWRPIVSGSTIQLCGFRIFYDAPGFGAGYLPAIRNGSP